MSTLIPVRMDQAELADILTDMATSVRSGCAEGLLHWRPARPAHRGAGSLHVNGFYRAAGNTTTIGSPATGEVYDVPLSALQVDPAPEASTR